MNKGEGGGLGAVCNHYSDLRFSVFPSDPFSSVLSPFQLFIIWPCLKRTGSNQIEEFDWLKSILTAV